MGIALSFSRTFTAVPGRTLDERHVGSAGTPVPWAGLNAAVATHTTKGAYASATTLEFYHKRLTTWNPCMASGNGHPALETPILLAVLTTGGVSKVPAPLSTPLAQVAAFLSDVHCRQAMLCFAPAVPLLHPACSEYVFAPQVRH